MFCTSCGNEINDNAVICPKCGVPTNNYIANRNQSNGESNGNLTTIIKVFLIISCVFSIFSFLLPLAWCLPMTMRYCRAKENGEEIGMGFKVCTLLFVNAIAGILMICEK